jgi:hypothetical protein
VDAPFDVTLECPSTCVVGEFQSMVIHIHSKIWSMERLLVQLLLHENLIISGPTSCSIEVIYLFGRITALYVK